MKKLLLSIIVILFAVLFLFPEEEKKIEVIADVANIRSIPGMEGRVIGKAFRGEVYNFEKKDGEWYKILFQKEGHKFGFLHRITVKEIYSENKIVKSPDKEKIEKVTADKRSDRKEPKKRKKSKKVKKKKNKVISEKLFSGFFLKGGLMTSPSGVGFGDGSSCVD